MGEIEQTIRATLTQIETQRDVRILHAVESGSRAWGFASPDSDYDVRFIYVGALASYLSLGWSRDVIEWQLDAVYDVNGWDLAKALRLLHDSNPVLFEWRDSPIVYTTRPEWAVVDAVFERYFQPKKAMHHYLSMAHRNIVAYLAAEQVKLKKYFYCIRPLLAAEWIRRFSSPPPTAFGRLVDAVLPSSVRSPLNDLLAIKAETSELGEAPHIPVLDAFIRDEYDRLQVVAETMPPRRGEGWQPLDAVFRSLVLGT